MFETDNQFRFDLNKATANKDSVFFGDKYRITILTERLIRLEYNEFGNFEDYPTEQVWYRNFEKPEFTVNENKRVLNIKTKYFELNYIKERKFYGGKLNPIRNLKITNLNNEKIWYYGHPEVRNYHYRPFSIDDKTLKKSLYSLDGFVSIDDSKTPLILPNGVFKKRDSSGVDLYVFIYGDDFVYCLNDYFMLTGYPPLIPRYALGNWWCKEDTYNDFDIAHIVKKFSDNHIPISVFTLNKWQSNNSYRFNELYKDPKSLINYMHSQKIKIGLSIDYPYIFKKENIDIYNRVRTYLSVDKNGDIPFNVFDEKYIEIFLKIIIKPLNDLGVDFYSIDSFNTKDLEKLSILKHYLSFYNISNKRILETSRNFDYSSHRYPVLYGGKTNVSWETLKKIPEFNLAISNMGISFFSHDAGGSSDGIEDNELFNRFIQLLTFSPILRLGSDSGKYYKREPWKWGLKTKEISTRFLNLRHRLIPYLYTESYKYYKYGKPLVEPLYNKYSWLYDDLLYKDEYLFGSTFLICPITIKKDYLMDRVIQKLYLPDGMWYDFFTGKQFKGNKKYVTFFKDQEYPVFVKAGSIIPLGLNPSNDTSSPKDMEIQVFPGENNTYSIYEDDGETNDYLNGKYLITNIEFVYQKNNYKLTILPVSGVKGVVPDRRNYKIRFKNTKPTSIVSSFINSDRVSNINYKDDTDLVIEIKDVPTYSQLTILCSGEDIEISATRIINEDIVSIISDLPIKTVVKQKIDDIMFSSDTSLKKKRIEIRKLAHGKNFLERKYIDLLLKLLEYINEV